MTSDDIRELGNKLFRFESPSQDHDWFGYWISADSANNTADALNACANLLDVIHGDLMDPQLLKAIAAIEEL